MAAAHRTNFLASDRDIVNRWSAKQSLAPQLGNRPGTSVQWHGAETVERALAFVARDAVDLLTSAWAERIRICENPLCAGLFADLSRPGRRRWCAMNTCGNLAKKQALRHRRPTNRSKRSDTGGRSHRRGSQVARPNMRISKKSVPLMPLKDFGSSPLIEHGSLPTHSTSPWCARPLRRSRSIRRSGTDRPSAPESAHQQWGESPHRTEHWLSVVEGNCVAREGGVESNRRRTASP